MESLELGEWIKHVHDQCITIPDVLNMKEGESKRVLVLDRNLYDIVCENNPADTPLTLFEFFRLNSAWYTHHYDLKGSIRWDFDGPGETKNSLLDTSFEFHLEYAPNSWYPLKNGFLPATDPQEIVRFPWQESQHWRQFSPNTRVGWRGEMIDWEKLEVLPRVYWQKNKS